MIGEFLKAIVLGAVQGVSEFLPISSTGHLIIAEHILGISQQTYGLSFDAALHLGTLLAVIWFFRSEWAGLSKSAFQIIKSRQIHTQSEKLVLLLVIGTIPAVIIGLLFEDVIDNAFRNPLLVGITLILFSFVLWYVEQAGKKSKKIENLKSKDAVLIGIAQSIALIPGVSRSGITMAAGMHLRLTREQAARFTFLLSAPIVAGAGGKKMLEVIELFLNQKLSPSEMLFFLTGMVSAGIFGYFTIKYLLAYLSRHTLYPFIVYRIFIGLVIIGSTFFLR